MGETMPGLNVSFEEGLKGDYLQDSKSEAVRAKSPLKLSSNDHDSDGGWFLTTSSKRTTVDSSLAVTPRSQGSPLPLNFLFRHLSGIKSTLAEAMVVAQMSYSSASETASHTSGPFRKRHSYTRVKHRRPKGAALRAMNSSAMVTSLMLQDKEPSEISDESEESKPRDRKFFNYVGSKDLYERQRISAYEKSRYVDTSFKGGEGRHFRKTKRRKVAEQKGQELVYASRRLVLGKWDVQTALGSLLQLQENRHSELGDLTVPKVAESLSFSSDGAWRWQECVVVTYDSSSGMYRTLSSEDLSREPWGSQNLSGYSTQLESTPLCNSNFGSIGVSLDSSPSWRSKVTSRGWSRMELDDQQIPTRLVARLNIRLPEEPEASRSFTDHDSGWKSITPGMQSSSIREPVTARANDVDDPFMEPLSKASKPQRRLRSEDIPTHSSTQGGVRYGQSCSVLSHCSTRESVRHGDVASGVCVSALKQALIPMFGVESRLGVGMKSSTSEKNTSTRRMSVLRKSGAFMVPGEFRTGGNVISENLIIRRRNDRSESGKCILYDLFPLLSEIAQEYEHAASLTECMDKTSLPKAGTEYVLKGPRPVGFGGHSFLVHSVNLAASAALLQPGLQSAMLLVVDSVKMLEEARLLAVSVPCVSITKALELQSNTIGENIDYIKNRVLANAKDALNTALVRDKGLTNIENGSSLFIRISRWANILTETALAKALKGTLDMYAARFEAKPNLLFQAEDSPYLARPLFLVKLCISAEKLAYRTPLSKVDVFSGKLLDDVLEALLSLPFMDTKELEHSKVQRDVLLNAASEALPICRHRVAEAVSYSTKAVDAVQATLAALWTDFIIIKHELDSKARKVASSFQGYLRLGKKNCSTQEDGLIVEVSCQSEKMQEPNDPEHCNSVPGSFEDLVCTVKTILDKQGKLLSALTAAHGQVLGLLFRFDCDEMLLRTTCIGYDSKQRAANILLRGLRATIRQLNEQIDNDERILATSLSSVNPKFFGEVQSVIQSYEADPHPLTRGLNLLRACHSALENLCVDVSDDDVYAYWSLYARIQNMFVMVTSKDKFLMSARSLVMASIRAEQRSNLRRVTGLVTSIGDLEALKDPTEAFDNEALVQRKLESLHSMTAEVESLGKKEKLLEICENRECTLILAPAISKMEHLTFFWSTVANWTRAREFWMLQIFQKLNVDQMFVMVQEFGNELTNLVHNSITSSENQETLVAVADEVNETLTRLPLLLRLHHPGVRRIHWIELASKTGCWAFHDGAEGLTLKSVLELPVLFSHQEIIWTVLERAAEEYNQEVCLEKMEEEMRSAVLELSPYNEDGGRQMLRGSELVLDLLYDQLVAVGCMLRSPFAKALEGPVRAWQDKLRLLLHLLEGLLHFQKWFKILWPIFRSVNIRQQLLDESGKFAEIDYLWKQVLDTVVQRRCFMHLCESTIIFDEIPESIGALEGIMCSLINLLERKRTTFPRFFILSNDELLQVLSQEQNPNIIQYCLCKCFCELYSIEFASEAQVTGLWIDKAEYLPFLEPVRTSSRPVEEWMAAVEKEMKYTVTQTILGRLEALQMSTSSCASREKQEGPGSAGRSRNSQRLTKPPALHWIARFGKPVQKDYTENLSSTSASVCGAVCQVLVVAANLAFCSQVERILTRKVNIMKELQLQLQNLTEEIQEYLSEIKSCAPTDNKGSYKSLVLLLIYFRDVINGLIVGTWIGPESFEWQRTMRYYWHPTGDCRVCIMNIDRSYGCELINYQNRLVMTSLTEKCFLGLLYAFSLGLGGMVTGAAGVGKTESVKDCAKALGKHCIVMSCSKEFDHQTIGNVLKGMASGGLWLCLNEFACLTADVVSVLIQQLLSIKHAVATKAQRYNFEGFGLQLDPTFAICATTTPKLTAGTDYIRYTRSSFRSVTMMMPDCKSIVQVLLTVEGFSDPLNVAHKLTLCFKMAGEQLSFKDNHCDFGLRAMRAVIKWMSVLNSAPEMQSADGAVDRYGDLILCKTLQQYCLPRLVGDGFLLFSNLLKDLFPHLEAPPPGERALEMSINSTLIQRYLISHEPLVQKCLQLHGAMKVHRGVIIVGGPGTGKTQCYFTLSHAINLMNNTSGNDITLERRVDQTYPSVTLRVVNPSAVSRAHLFGSTNPKTQTWHDGIMPNILHECEASVEDGGKMWMVLDGDMDSISLEMVSTMVDETGLLCLNNGKRVLLPSIDIFSMLFEVENLTSVSPGTVSRCGIVLMDSEDQSWKVMVTLWLQRCPASECQALFQELFDKFLAPCLEVATRFSELPVAHVGLINNLLNFLEAGLKLAGVWSDHALIVKERQPNSEISGLQSKRSKMKSNVETDKVSAKSSIEKLSRVTHSITQRQKQIRDAVNWRRLHHHRLFTCASQETQEEHINNGKEESGNSKYVPEEIYVSTGATNVKQTLEMPYGKSILGSLFIFGLVWAVGGPLSPTETSERFEKVLRNVAVLCSEKLGPLPEGSIYDYYYDMEKQTWKSWEELLIHAQSLSVTSTNISPWSQTIGNGFHSGLSLERGALFVPTVETQRMQFLAHSLGKLGRAVLLAGAPGTGKTIVAAQLLHQHATTANCQVIGMTLNSTSCGSTLHDILRPKLTFWKRRSLIPAVNGKMVVFVDDLNNAQLHAGKNSPALQFLRFLVEQKGWYGLPMDASFTAVDGLLHLAAMTKLGPKIKSPLARLCRHYFIIQSPDYRSSSLHSIFLAALKTCSYELDTSVDKPSMLSLLSQACVEVYTHLRIKLPSSSDNFSSLLSLHDLFLVRRLLLLGSDQTTKSLQKFFNRWSYEFCRVSCDRLKSVSDRRVVISALRLTMEDILKLKSDDHKQYLESLIDEEQQPIFGSYFRDVRAGIVQPWSEYEEVTCRKDWEETMLKFLASYTADETSQTPVVLFPGALSHLSRLLNILRLAEGHAFLRGYSGSGRRSLARLASYVLGYTIFEIQVNGNYTSQQWTADLCNLLKTCSLRAKATMFLITIEADCSIQKHIMEDLNLIVHCGEAMHLLGEEEKYYIQQELHRIQEANVLYPEFNPGNDREQYLHNCFVNCLKENLHLVICAENATYKNAMSRGSIASTLVSQHFRVDYYGNWAPVALQAVAKVTLVKYALVRNLSPVDMELLTKSCSMIHTISSRLTAAVTLKGCRSLVGMPSYHEMLCIFGTVSEKKRREVDRNLYRLDTGLQKLQSTRILVENMQHELQELLRRKDHTDSHMDRLFLSISEEQVQMDKALEDVAHDERVAAEEAESCKRLAQEAQDQVQEVAPEVLIAIKQLSQLNKKDISELKSFTQPPPRLLTVLEALCIILKKEPKHIKHTTLSGSPKNEAANSYWPIARELLSQVDFVKMLLSFNKDAMENCTMENLKPYMENPLFKPEKVRRISVACRSICIWIRAMYNYHYAKTVKMEPRIERLKIANHNLDICKERLKEARHRLAIAEQNLMNLRARYDDASSIKDGLAKKAEESEVRLQRAVRLISRLDGECCRWSIQINDLKAQRKNVIGDTILASGIVAYLGSFSASIRCKFISEWQESFQKMGLSYSTNFSLVTFYTKRQDIKAWAAAGLPPDDHSMETAVILSNSSRPLLVLDPQKQVSKWIGSIEDPLNISVVDINSSVILEEAHSSSMTGKILIVENIGNATHPDLLKQILSLPRDGIPTNMKSLGSEWTEQESLSNKRIHCGCILLTYEQGFKYSDEVNVSVSLKVVDFSITFHGLCSQLLSIATEKERLDLEEERAHLMHQRLLLSCRLQEIEDCVLTLIQGVRVTILDDEALEEALAKATATHADIQTKLARAAVTEEAVEVTRKRHSPLAERAAILYSCIADVSRLESFYQWTLPWFKTVYSTSMQRTSALNPVDFLTRLEYLITKITFAIYKKICCGLLYKHRILFGLLVVFRLAQARYDVDREEWMFLLQGKNGTSFGCLDESCPAWLEPTSNQWKQLQALSKFPRFEGLVEDLNQESWRQFYCSSHSYTLPGSWQERLGPFRSLLVLRCLRLDMVMEAVEQLIRDQLNSRKEDLEEFSVENAYEESTKETPITCILKGVVSPLDEIMICAKRRNMLKRLWVFSLEHCQEPKMLEAIKEAANWGKWVLLHNCHMNIPWINNCLRVALNDVKTRQIHDSFRLWLTTESIPGRPPYLLEDSIKIVAEPAKGVKSKMVQILMIEKADEIYLGQRQLLVDDNGVTHSKELLRLALFHSLVQERAHFGAMGWNLPVELDHTVFNLAKVELCKLPVAGSNSSFTVKELSQNKSKEKAREMNRMICLQYMMTKVIYGGYIIDDWDEYLMYEVFQHCFNSNENGSCESFLSAYLPKGRGTLDDFLMQAHNLPDPDDPEVMGLPKEAVIDRAREDTRELLKEALTIETSRESFMAPLTNIFETKKSLVLECFLEIGGSMATTLNEHILRSQNQETAGPFSLLLLQGSKSPQYLPSSTSLEVQRYNRLTSIMRASVAKAVKVIEIYGDMTPDVEALCESILAGQVPGLWLLNGYASLKLLTCWMRDFRSRIDYMRQWVEKGRPRVMWVSVLFFPQAVFAATLQNSARSRKLPLSSLHLEVSVIETDAEVGREPDDGCYISGLYLEGARWDSESHALAESEPNHLTSKMCTLWLRPCRERLTDNSRTYSCPIYTTQARNG